MTSCATSASPELDRTGAVRTRGAGDLDGPNRLAEAHLELVDHLVRATMSRVPSHVDRDDLRSAGLVALVQAARSFESDRGATFATYASVRIRGALVDQLRSVDWATRSVRRRNREIAETRERLAATPGRVADEAAVAAVLGLEVGDVRRARHDADRATVSSLDVDHGLPRAELATSPETGPESSLELAERLEYLQVAVAELPARLRRVIEAYFFDERPMAEIGRELGVTQSRVSQLRSEAVVLLRDALNSALDPHLVQRPASPGGVVARRRDAFAAAVAARHLATRPGRPAVSSVRAG
jgi:RNA polymerase sigma factor for flagellar operon FliA